MFHNRTLNNRINGIHERVLKVVYRDKTSNFTELLQNNNIVTVHQRNSQILASEVYKVKMGLAPQLFPKLSLLSTQAYNLRHCGTEYLSFLGPKI